MTNMNIVNELTYDGEIYRWTGSLSKLKTFVEKTLNAKGTWTSPGGDVKLFKDDDSDLIIKWYGPRSKKLITLTDNCDHPLKLKLECRATLGLRIKETTLGLGSKETTKDAIPRPPEVRSSACSCSCKSVVTDLVGVKLDMVILETRLGSIISPDEMTIEINSLHSKHKDLEAIIRKQDEVINKLYEDNTLIKSKLLSLEMINPSASINDLKNNACSSTNREVNSVCESISDNANDQHLNNSTKTIIGTAANNKNLTLDKFPNINGLANIISVPDNYSKNTTINNASPINLKTPQIHQQSLSTHKENNATCNKQDEITAVKPQNKHHKNTIHPDLRWLPTVILV